jgi:putative salt-induced outer membrane protein YdiY
MAISLKTLTIMLALFFLICGTVAADQLQLENGDIITGRIIRMENQKLVFKTDYAGEISVAWEKIVKAITEDPIKVVLKDGSILAGYTGETVKDSITLKGQQHEIPVLLELAEVKAINPIHKPAVKIKARANFGITQERGNTDTDQTHIDGEFTARTEENRFMLGGELNDEKNGGVSSADNWNAYGQYNHFITERGFLYAFGLFEYDEFTDLDLRSTLSVGPGYQFFESDELNLFVAAGPGYVNEDFIEAEDTNYAIAGWTISYDQYFFDKTFQLFHRQNGYIQGDDTDNWLIKTRQGIRFPVYKGFTTTFQYNYDYDNQPSAEADKKWDSKLMFLLGYELNT